MAVAYSVSRVTVGGGGATAEFLVKRSGNRDEIAAASSVGFATSDGSARSGTDYVGTAGVLNFGPGETQASVEVMTLPKSASTAPSTTFVFGLEGGGSTTGTIVPGDTANLSQTYLYLPQDDASVIVPTAGSPGDNLKYQAVYSGFSDPPDNSVEMPLGYLRIGHARSDMNEYERTVVNGDAYVPVWGGTAKDGTPEELGPLIHMMVPRGVSRLGLSADDVADAMQDNAHLDGIFLHSDKNWIVTVGEHKNEVVQGDYTQYVGGRVRANFMGPEARWSYMDGPSNLRWAQGTEKVNGKVWGYAISTCRNLGINCDWTINYRLGPSFTASASADMTVANAAKYDVSNSVAMEVKGLEASISCNVKGEYNVNIPGLSRATTETEFTKEASESITLSVNPATAIPRSAGVANLAIANAAAAMAATSTGWIVDFEPDGAFYRNVNAEELSSAYNDSFTEVIPDTFGGLAALTAVFVMLTAVQQQTEALVPAATPKISMTPEALTLSCGFSSIVINEEGISIQAGEFAVAAVSVGIEGGENVSLGAEGGIILGAEAIQVIGPMTATEEILAFGNITSEAMVYGTFMETA